MDDPRFDAIAQGQRRVGLDVPAANEQVAQFPLEEKRRLVTPSDDDITR